MGEPATNRGSLARLLGNTSKPILHPPTRKSVSPTHGNFECKNDIRMAWHAKSTMTYITNFDETVYKFLIISSCHS